MANKADLDRLVRKVYPDLENTRGMGMYLSPMCHRGEGAVLAWYDGEGHVTLACPTCCGAVLTLQVSREEEKVSQKPLTADAIHNWGERYILARYRGIAPEIQAAALAAMRRHHQQGTSAQEEADAINTHYNLQEKTP